MIFAIHEILRISEFTIFAGCQLMNWDDDKCDCSVGIYDVIVGEECLRRRIMVPLVKSVSFTSDQRSTCIVLTQ